MKCNSEPRSRSAIPRAVARAGFTPYAVPLVMLVAFTFSISARAEVEFKPYVEALYGYTSNVFALRQDTNQALIGADESDRSLSYGAGFALNETFGRQQLTLTGKGLRTEFEEFDELNHNEYEADAAWNWQVGRVLDGTLGYEVMQRMVPFADTGEISTELLLENSHRANVGINVAVTPVWRLETKGIRTDLDSPRTGAQSLQQEETLVGAGIKYVGRAHLSAGLELTDTDGEVTGFLGPGNRSYDQSSAELVADYSVSGKSTFGATVGYTKRDDEVEGDVDAVTGALRYTRAVTRKTSVVLEFTRELSSYLRNDGVQSELATGLTAGVNWQATAKTGFGLTVGYQRSEFPNRAVSDVVRGREDDFGFSELHINYQVTRWLLIHPFVRYEDRDSNDPIYTYNNTYVALQLKATMR